MQTFFIIASVLADFSFATVASLGSSYAAGAGTIPYGSLLADLLSVDFLNLAQVGLMGALEVGNHPLTT